MPSLHYGLVQTAHRKSNASRGSIPVTWRHIQWIDSVGLIELRRMCCSGPDRQRSGSKLTHRLTLP
jgi:hypothetical protein